MAQPRSRFPAYPPDLPEGLQLYLEAIRKEISTLGVSGGASIRIEESDAVVSTGANVIDFFGTDFDVTQSPVGEANIAISSAIARTGHTHDAADVTTGIFSRARLPSAIAYEDEANTFTLTQTFSVQLVSSVTTGTAPFSVASTTVVTNLNADFLDGQTGTFYTDLANATGNLAYARLPTGGGTWANGGTLSITGGVTTVAGLTSSADITAQARFLLTTAASKIVPGATSLALRNNADSADNAIWTNAGDATFRTKLTMPGPLVLTTAASTIVPGATSLALRNTADSANNLLLTDAGIATLRNDLIIGTLGQFDSADTPLEGQLLVYHAGGTAKWQAETFITVYAQGDSKVELLTDGSLTAAAYILRDPGTAGAAAPPNDPTVPIVSVDHLAHTLEIRSYVKTANFRYFEWQYCTGAACTGWVALVLSTSTKIVHSRLTDGTVYRYRVRAVGRDGDLTSFFTTGDNTATANSESMAFGTIIASEIAVANLSAISADFGIITAGIARNTGNTAGINFGGAGGIPGTWTSGINFEAAAGAGSMTRYINFTATGANPVIKHEKLSLNADGTALFTGQINIDSPDQAIGGFGSAAIILRDPDVAHGITDYVTTDTYGTFGIYSGTEGGLLISGWAENAAANNVPSLYFVGVTGETTVSIAPILFDAYSKSGTGVVNVSGEDEFVRFGGGGVYSLFMGDKSLELRGGYGGKNRTASALRIGGGGSTPNAGSLAWGDNTGWKLNLGTIVSSTFTTRFSFFDTGELAFGVAVSKIIPGATSLSLRNNADSADNLLVVDAGDVTIAGSLTVVGGLKLRSSNVTSVGTGAATAETDLMTHTLPTLASGDEVEVFAEGLVTGTNNTKTIRFKVGGTTYGTITCAAGTTGDYYFHLRLVKDGATTRHSVATSNDTLGITSNIFAGSIAVDLSGAIIKVTGQTTNAADEVTTEAMTIMIYKA